jgi:hypothetical protein
MHVYNIYDLLSRPPMKSSVMTRILANGAKVLRTFFVKVPATIHIGAVTFHTVHIAFQSLLLPPSLPYLL